MSLRLIWCFDCRGSLGNQNSPAAWRFSSLKINKTSPKSTNPVPGSWGWDALISVCATVSALFAPAVLVLNLPIGTGIVWFVWLVTAMLTVDIAIRYRRHNLSGALAVDVLAAVPFNLIFGGPTPWQLLRLLKLFRVAQFLKHWWNRYIEHTNLLRLVFFLYWMSLVDALACLWLDGPAESCRRSRRLDSIPGRSVLVRYHAQHGGLR